ncbi:MAG: transcription termination factor NusA, partial [Planctomycetes bacterium]|nr:transcription termination factor NusA [Planctomycetota bacterium]
MNGPELLRIVDTMHREKSIPKEVIFNGIESALQLAAQRQAGEEEDVLVHIDRMSGQIIAQRGDQLVDPELLGRISAQSAKQVMIQKIREAESEGVFTEYQARKGEMVTGTIQRVDAGTAIVSLSKDGKNAANTIEALLPRSEQIPGETPHVNDRIKAVVMEVRRNGHRVKIVLSRCHPDFVRSLFEQEIPEIADRTIEIKNVAREAGYRSKVAVSSIDMKVDCVGACVGVRGSRIKNVIDELNGERIDIVRWNDSLQVMIPNALQPAEISEVMLYSTLGRAVVLVAEDQLSLAIGRRGQNVRLASKLVGWDIEIMTHEELGESVEKAEHWFSQIPNASPELVEFLITEG